MAKEAVDHRPDLRVLVVLCLLWTALPGGLVLWTLSVYERLPDPIARHWGLAGDADGFSSLTSMLWIAPVLALMSAVPLGLAGCFGRQPTTLRRQLAGISAFLTVFIIALIGDSFRKQLDLADPTQAPAPSIALSLIAGLVAAGVVAALVRRSPTDPPAHSPGPPPAALARVDPGTPLQWEAAPMGLDTSAKFLLGLTTLGLVALSVAMSWWLMVLAIGCALLSGLGDRFRTTIDDEGLHVRMLGRRVAHVAASEVARAEATVVDPFWEFGGWGLRTDVAGRVGVVTRKGPALRVVRGDDTQVIITVDDPDTAAATLHSLADRYHERRGGVTIPD